MPSSPHSIDFGLAQLDRRDGAVDLLQVRLGIADATSGPLCASAKRSIGATSASSPGAMTAMFGNRRMYGVSKTP